MPSAGEVVLNVGWERNGGVPVLVSALPPNPESSPPPGLRLVGLFSLRAVDSISGEHRSGRSSVLPACSELEKGPRDFLLFVLARAWAVLLMSYFRTKNIYGVPSFPIWSMRPLK